MSNWIVIPVVGVSVLIGLIAIIMIGLVVINAACRENT